ncbi:MBL fold metallo-hydrolase [bacterium]|nr:MBL fold metallo-hydrolase [bacterium]
MRVTFWGTRGSLPTPMDTAEFRIKAKRLLMNARDIDLSDEMAVDEYLDNSALPHAMTFGGNTPCIEVTEGDEHLIFDCGSGMRVLGHSMMKSGFTPGSRIDIFQTHTHWDHIMGFPFFAPALAGRADIHIYGVHPGLKERFGQQMDRIHFPITMDEMSSSVTFHQLSSGEKVTVGAFTVSNKGLHHPGGSYAYRINAGNRCLVFATDGEYNDPNNEGLDGYVDFFRDSDVLIFDAMYATLEQTVEKENYGHSTAVIGVDLALSASVGKLVLFHHDPESNDTQIAKSYLDARKYLKNREHEFPGNGLSIVTSYDGLVLDV